MITISPIFLKCLIHHSAVQGSEKFSCKMSDAHVHACLATQQSPTLCDSSDCGNQLPLSLGFSRQEYWSGLPFPSPGDLSHPGIELVSPAASVLIDRFFTTEPPGKPKGPGSKYSRL